jgi:hypothetical protein
MIDLFCFGIKKIKKWFYKSILSILIYYLFDCLLPRSSKRIFSQSEFKKKEDLIEEMRQKLPRISNKYLLSLNKLGKEVLYESQYIDLLLQVSLVVM